MRYRRALLFIVALGLTAAALRCAGDPDHDGERGAVPSGDLCSSACRQRANAGCVADEATCTQTCEIARAVGYCGAELEAKLTCLVGADHLHCGRPPTGSPCDDVELALERCLSTHSVGDTPPDCTGNDCTWVCDPIGTRLCRPGAEYDCECPSGAQGQARCTDDGCLLQPCQCQP